MAKLILSPANSALLRRLAEEGSGTNQDAIQALKMALNAQQPKMTVDSPAIPATDKDAQQAVVLDHTLLIKVATWAQDDANVGASEEDVMKLKLSSLVVGSQVYVPPKPVFQRSKELEDSLAAIRRAQEEAEYQRISTLTTSSSVGYKIPSSYVNISGIDATLPLSQRFSSPSSSSSNKISAKEEEKAWQEAQRTLSVILNIFLSTLATATAAWWASGNASMGHKVLVSMLVAVVTAVAEVVLYSRYQVYVKESKKIKKGRMTGSDVNKKGGIEGFKPLQLGPTSSSARSRQNTAKEEAKREPS